MNSPHRDGAVSTLVRSPGLEAAAVEAVVTVPTYKRPGQVLATLRSIRAQESSRRVATILIENEAEKREGAQAAAPLFAGGEMEGLVIVAHERGNCSAYNAGWSAALRLFPSFSHLLVIDDDEVAEPGWLEAMLAASARFGADIVGGPQVPLFPEDAPARFRSHPVFAPPYQASGLVPALYSSGNLAVRRRVLAEMPAPFLDTRFNFLGGGDADFLSRAAARGFRLAWCAEGQVTETVPAQRLTRGWVNRRAVRNGVISTLVEKRRRAGETFGGLTTAAKSAALLTASPLRAVAALARTGSAEAALYPMQIGLGRILAHVGYEHEQYRHPERN